MPVLIAAARGAAEVAKRTSASPTVQAIAETATNPKRATRRLIYVAPAMALAGLLLITALLGGGGVVHPSCAGQTVVVFDGELDQVLLTIRTIESGNSYTAQAAGSSASGAYQFINSTWGNYGGYPEAWQAPPDTQDAKAAEWASIILQNHNGDVSVVPVVWYIGHLPGPGSAEWDTVPVPDAGNVLTPREYQTKWLGVYANPTAAIPWNPDEGGEDGQTCSGVVGEGDYRIPDGVTQLVASNISWGGWSNGQIPLDAMRYSANSNYMHPGSLRGMGSATCRGARRRVRPTRQRLPTGGRRWSDIGQLEPRMGTRDRHLRPRCRHQTRPQSMQHSPPTHTSGSPTTLRSTGSSIPRGPNRCRSAGTATAATSATPAASWNRGTGSGLRS